MTVYRLLNTRLQENTHSYSWRRSVLREIVGALFSEEECTVEGGNSGMIYAAVYFSLSKEKKCLAYKI